jgi:membrane protease YdiL (CAAX protease family)
MQQVRQKYYPTILKAIHLLILYLFIQTVVDFPLALIDYYNGTDYLYHPVKKAVLGVGSTLFILYYGFRKSKAPFNKVFPLRFFNPLILIPLFTFFWGAHQLLDEVNYAIEKIIPAPPWFWELFSNIFESDFGWWGAFMKVAVVAPIVEELIFRGLIFQGFRRNYHKIVAVIMSALLFSLFHLNPWQMPATFVLGLLLGWLMIRTNSLILCILAHSLNNLLVLLTVTFWQDINTFPLFLMEKKETIELSSLLVVFSLILIYLLSLWPKRKIITRQAKKN